MNTVAEQLTEELDTVPQPATSHPQWTYSSSQVLIALRKAIELAEQSTDVIAAK